MKRAFILSSVVVTVAFVGLAIAKAPLPDQGARPLADEHQHKEGEKHKDGEKHEHKEGEHKDEHKGETKDLGKKGISGYTVHVAQVGDVKAGEEAVFVLTLTGGSGKPKAIRGWVGVESGEGSIKSKAEDEEKEYHLHHEVSKPLPSKSKLWIELETASGKKRTSYDYKKEGKPSTVPASR